MSNKHPDVIAWEKWKRSDEGKRCLADSASGQFLENRLWRAFMDGRKLCPKCKKVPDGHGFDGYCLDCWPGYDSCARPGCRHYRCEHMFAGANVMETVYSKDNPKSVGSQVEWPVGCTVDDGPEHCPEFMETEKVESGPHISIARCICDGRSDNPKCPLHESEKTWKSGAGCRGNEQPKNRWAKGPRPASARGRI